MSELKSSGSVLSYLSGWLNHLDENQRETKKILREIIAFIMNDTIKN